MSSNNNETKAQPWKAGHGEGSEEFSAAANVIPKNSTDNPNNTADLFRYAGGKVVALEKLLHDTQKEIEPTEKGDGQSERGPDLFRCAGGKKATLEKLLHDTYKELETDSKDETATDGSQGN